MANLGWNPAAKHRWWYYYQLPNLYESCSNKTPLHHQKYGFQGSLATKEKDIVAMLSTIKQVVTYFLQTSIKITTRLWMAHANSPYHHLLSTQSTAPLPTKLVILKSGIKHYGTPVTSLIIVMVCVGTKKSPLIANRVYVLQKPTLHLPQPTWLMMSHQTKNLLPINIFWPIMAMQLPPCWHRPLIWAATIQSFKIKLQWLYLQPTSCDSYAMDWLKYHPLFTSTFYLIFHGQSSYNSLQIGREL